MKSDVIDLEARLIRETPAARLFDFGTDDPVWLPKSAHEWDDTDNTVTLPERLAIQKEIV